MCTPCAEHGADAGQTPLDLLLWHLLNFSISCCRQIFCKKWLRSTEEVHKHRSIMASSISRQTTARGCDTGRDWSDTGRETGTPSQQPHRPPALPCTQGATMPSTGSTKLGKPSSLAGSTQYSKAHVPCMATGAGAQGQARSPAHTLCPVKCATHCSPLQSSVKATSMEWLPPCLLEGALHWVELPAPPCTAQPERAKRLLFILPLSICPFPHEAHGVLRGRAGEVPALEPQS